MGELVELVDGLPNLCGSEDVVAEARAMAASRPVHEGRSVLEDATAAFAIALHMHQPLIPAAGDDLRRAGIVSNLADMMDHPEIGDNHNAPVFAWCYKRMDEFVTRLLGDGAEPRAMLDYSGTLLYGLRQMGRHDVLEALDHLANDPSARQAVEWLGATWGHAVAPSTPPQDFALHVRAWQHHFAAIFGLEALGRVRGFSPAEMALPNHPDVAFQFVRTLRDAGYRYVLVQEHTVERPDGGPVAAAHLPHRLVCRSASGDAASIVAFVKTQGSDTKLVGQMQPYYEALGLSRQPLAGRDVPPVVAQIADGENGGVMMNEFPPKYEEVVRLSSHGPNPGVNLTEYLEHLDALGVGEDDLAPLQPIHQHRVWSRMAPGEGTERLASVIDGLRGEDDRFHMDGGSWTSDVSWVSGYDSVLVPMERASSEFHRRVLARGIPSSDPRYRRALFLLLSCETSCYRYWGTGRWTDFGAELARRAIEASTAP